MVCVCSWLSKCWICVWVILHLCSTICYAADFQVVGPEGPLTADAGGDLVLPCSLKPSMSAEGMTVEWFRLDDQGQSSVVHLYKDHKDINTNQMSSYRGRTSLFKEELKKGNASLLIKQLSVADRGHYKCFVQSTDYDDISVQLSVISSLISLHKVDGEGFSLVCESSGWNPEPAVVWLDGEGRSLSANNQEWNSDGLTVSRRLAVDKLEKNSTYICRVSQADKMKETIFHINGVVAMMATLVAVAVVVSVGDVSDAIYKRQKVLDLHWPLPFSSRWAGSKLKSCGFNFLASIIVPLIKGTEPQVAMGSMTLVI
ncbi:butyrophilin-like protein 10 [Sardina pilchardus]|uniref:butyrophilin-like protein 10 n=1 Tax=Sardina pilchardus TaxID=27697 RepID=UPI002E1145AB